MGRQSARHTVTKATAKPTYSVMVAESIRQLAERTGSSVPAITKQVTALYKIDINKTALSAALKKGVDSGDLVKVKASYKLGKKVKAPAKPKKAPAAPAKVVAPKPATKKKTTTVTKPKKVITKKTATKTKTSAKTKAASKTSSKISTKSTTSKKATTGTKKRATSRK